MNDKTTAEQSYDAHRSESTSRLRLAILGFGRAGEALAREFSAASRETQAQCELIGVWNRTPRSLQPDLTGHFALHSGTPTPPQSLVDAADVLILAVHDSAIATLAGALSPAPGTVLLHLSGALPGSALGPLPEGIHGGCYHPLQSFRSDRPPELPVPAYWLALDGDTRALKVARTLAETTNHPSIVLDPAGKAAYHAAAVMTSGGMVALMSAATEALSAAGVAEPDRWPLLWPLAVGTLANLADGNFSSSLTGPVARGDADTTRSNLESLAGLDDIAAIYRVLGLRSLELAAQAGTARDRLQATANSLGEESI
jgi:predicted short-subunit dehydrogenase-like oxidoreductase (DUF2520 family)